MKFNCDPIVTPEEPDRRKQGFSYLSFRFAKEMEIMVQEGQPSKWFNEHQTYLESDIETVLNGGYCVASTITAMLMKALLTLIQEFLVMKYHGVDMTEQLDLGHENPQFIDTLYYLDDVFQTQLLKWNKSPPKDMASFEREAFDQNRKHEEEERKKKEEEAERKRLGLPDPKEAEKALAEEGIDFAMTEESKRQERERKEKEQAKPQLRGLAHLILSSSYPIYRLLNFLVVLYPRTDATRLGKCADLQEHLQHVGGDEEKAFDWPTFRLYVQRLAEIFVVPQLEEGVTITEATRRRWIDMLSFPLVEAAANEADRIFSAWRTNQYKAGCHLGVTAAYILHTIWYMKQDRQAYFGRMLTAATTVNLIISPAHDAMKTHWLHYHLWDQLYNLRRDPPDLPVDDLVDTEDLHGHVREYWNSEEKKPIFVSQAYGWMEQFGRRVRNRFNEKFGLKLLILTSTREGIDQICGENRNRECVPSYPSLIAKYEVLHYFAEQNVPICWVDLDIAWFQNPAKFLDDRRDFTFAPRDYLGVGLSPALVYVSPPVPGERQDNLDVVSAGVDYKEINSNNLIVSVLRKAKEWLRINPVGRDDQMWDVLV